MPNRLARSVSASAGMPSAAALRTASSSRTMPSLTEYSECSRRCTKRGGRVTAGTVSGGAAAGKTMAAFYADAVQVSARPPAISPYRKCGVTHFSDEVESLARTVQFQHQALDFPLPHVPNHVRIDRTFGFRPFRAE